MNNGLQIYWFIPTALEAITAGLVNQWLESADTAFVCMVGVYDIEIVLEENANIESIVKDQNGNFILKTYYYYNENNDLIKATIKYFLLEGYLEPDTEALAMSLGVTKIEGASSAIDFINTH